jgi:hypothetical protein
MHDALTRSLQLLSAHYPGAHLPHKNRDMQAIAQSRALSRMKKPRAL